MKSKLIFSAIICAQLLSAQNPVVNITNRVGNPPDGIYYKDLNNLLNPFEGTWLYTNGNTTVKFVLIKKVLQQNHLHYEDLIIGEYLYIKNGQTIVNTLGMIDNNYSNQRQHSINGNQILSNNSIPRCPECNPEEKRLSVSFIDPIADFPGRAVFRLVEVSGNPAILVNIRMSGKTLNPEEFYEYTEPVCPTGEFLLLRQ